MGLLFLQVSVITLFLGLSALIFIPLIGIFIRNSFSQSITNSYFHPTNKIWNAIQDQGQYNSWRSDLSNVEVFKNGSITWKEYLDDKNHLLYKQVNITPQNEMVIELIDSKFPVVLKRKYILWQQDYMSFLKIEDQLSIKRSSLRFLCLFFYDHKKTLKAIIKDLEFELDKRSGHKI